MRFDTLKGRERSVSYQTSCGLRTPSYLDEFPLVPAGLQHVEARVSANNDVERRLARLGGESPTGSAQHLLSTVRDAAKLASTVQGAGTLSGHPAKTLVRTNEDLAGSGRDGRAGVACELGYQANTTR